MRISNHIQNSKTVPWYLCTALTERWEKRKVDTTAKYVWDLKVIWGANRKITVFCDVTPCSLVLRYVCSAKTCCHHLLLGWNVKQRHLPGHWFPHTPRPSSSSYHTPLGTFIWKELSLNLRWVPVILRAIFFTICLCLFKQVKIQYKSYVTDTIRPFPNSSDILLSDVTQLTQWTAVNTNIKALIMWYSNSNLKME
jgi:hypothetical protein